MYTYPDWLVDRLGTTGRGGGLCDCVNHDTAECWINAHYRAEDDSAPSIYEVVDTSGCQYARGAEPGLIGLYSSEADAIAAMMGMYPCRDAAHCGSCNLQSGCPTAKPGRKEAT